MRKWTVVVAILFLFTHLAARSAPAENGTSQNASNHKERVYTLGFDHDWPPFCYAEDGHAKGFLIDIARAVADRSNFSFDFRPMQWGDAQEAILDGKIDMVTGMAKSQKRLKQYVFSKHPAAAISVKLFVKETSHIPSIDEFDGKLTVERGSLYSKIMKREYPEVPQLHSETERTSITEFANGRGDGCLGADLALFYYMRKEGLEGIKAVGTPLRNLDIYFTARKDHKTIIDNWNRGFARVRAGGEYARLFRKWFVKELSDEDVESMVKAARKARTFAYAPYSHFSVGAAVLTKSGKIYTGCNVENALLNLTTSALKVALLKAVSEGETDIRAAVNVMDDGSLGAPAGDERQLLYEFGRGILIVLKEGDQYVTRTVNELFPYPFDMNQ